MIPASAAVDNKGPYSCQSEETFSQRAQKSSGFLRKESEGHRGAVTCVKWSQESPVVVERFQSLTSTLPSVFSSTTPVMQAL